jgi:hypothetical protein
MTLIWALLTIVAIIAVTACSFVLRLSQRLNQLESDNQQQQKRLSRELAVVNSAAMGVGQRLLMAEKKLRSSIEKQQQLEGQSADYLPYSQAASLMADGAPAQQLVDRYGFSEAEASLMSRLKAGAEQQQQALAVS